MTLTFSRWVNASVTKIRLVTTVNHVLNIVHAKGSLMMSQGNILWTSAAKEFFGKHCNNVDFSLLYHVRILWLMHGLFDSGFTFLN